jgi:hypothetical protein
MEIIREMEIYAEAELSPGPNRAELHHYHHDDVVLTSAAPCRSHSRSGKSVQTLFRVGDP